MIVLAMWVVLTVIFQFSLGLFVKRSRKSLLQDYNLIAGRIWLLFLFYLSVLPYVCYILKNN